MIPATAKCNNSAAVLVISVVYGIEIMLTVSGANIAITEDQDEVVSIEVMRTTPDCHVGLPTDAAVPNLFLSMSST